MRGGARNATAAAPTAAANATIRLMRDSSREIKNDPDGASMPAASVIIPTLKRKIAMMAATESASAQGSTLASTGMSNEKP